MTMIVRREIIHFAIKNDKKHLLSVFDYDRRVLEQINKKALRKAQTTVAIKDDADEFYVEPQNKDVSSSSDEYGENMEL